MEFFISCCYTYFLDSIYQKTKHFSEHTCHTHILEPHDPRISDWILAGSVDAETFQHTVRNMQEGSGYYLRVVPLNELGKEP